MSELSAAQALDEMAQRFETYASDQLASRRWQQSSKDKRDCVLRAEVWGSAAGDLREAAIALNIDLIKAKTA